MIRNPYPAVLFLLMISVLVPRLGYGDIYGWSDEDGVRHYSNIGPPDQGKVRHTDETGPTGHPTKDRFKVIRVFDGDTIEAKGHDLIFKIRLVGIDTPEIGRKGQKGQPYAQRAKQILTDQVMGRQVRLEQFGTGGYNRILAEVFSNGRNINLYLIRTGMAEVYRGSLPPGLNSGAYKAAQNLAKKKRIGIWSLGKKYKSPRQWRKEHPW